MKNNLIKSGVAVTALICIEKILGFLKQIIFAAYFGSNEITDLYYLAQNIVSIVNTCFNKALPIAFLAVFVSQQGKSKKERELFVSNTINNGVLISFFLSGAMFFIAPCIAKYVTSIESRGILTAFIRILSFIIVLYCIAGMLGAALECANKFIPSKMGSFFISICEVIAIIFLGDRFGVVIAIYSIILGIIIHIIYEYLLFHKHYTFFPFYVNKNKEIEKIFLISIPIMVSTALTSINSLIDKMIASKIDAGIISALNYAHLISVELVSAVVITAMGSIFISKFSQYIKNRDLNGLESIVVDTIEIMTCIISFIFVVYMINAKEIITIVFQRGAFDYKATMKTSVMFWGYSIGLLFLPIQEIMIRVQYSFHNSKSPLYNSIISMVINVCCSIVMVYYIGEIGIAIGTSIALALSAGLNIYSTKKKHNMKVVFRINNYLKIGISSIIVAVINVLLIKIFQGYGIFLRLFLCVVIDFVIYLVALYLFKYDSLKYIFLFLKKNE